MNANVLARKARQALRFGKQNGWRTLGRTISSRFLQSGNLFGKISATRQYDELLDAAIDVSANVQQMPSKSINWFIPAVGKGSGGHLNILRFIKYLEDKGYENRIIIVGEPKPTSAVSAKKEIEQWFFPLKASVYVGLNADTPAAYFAMATSWRTAYYVRRFQACKEKCYFVQDFEPWFYPAGTDAILAENTYRFGFFAFTAGSWLAKKLNQDYGMRTRALGFSYDRSLYHPMPELRGQDKFRRVMFYARPPTARRAFELGILVLREVWRLMPEMRVVLAGWDVKDYDIPFPCEHLGLVEINQLPQLYGRCDAALVLSCSNLSLLPLELMACGVPVISNRAPYTQWLLNEENSMLAEPNIESLAQAVLQVINSPILADRLRAAGLAFASQTSWEREAGVLADGLSQLIVEEPHKNL
ncbi:glycosyltransferase [Uliginosibacterium gangwonense]|uniref:rhamnosyltransferase WsaF family glycosyltransferase n=1 Tax=Uliginosibacterium gangwonense TaxID=392736 RepID=UPI0003709BBE|nr:glycosyltransferase [Uliginosibacterium gangwonense]